MKNFYTTPQCKVVLIMGNDVLTSSGEIAVTPQTDGFELDMVWQQ